LVVSIFFPLHLVLTAAVAADTGRVALVIGNGGYQSAPLKNPVNDARDISAALKKIGFEVITTIDGSKREMIEAIDSFADKLRRADIGLFYFAGHGMQIRGRNYLIPVKVKVSSESDVEFESVDAGRVMGKMKDAGNKLNVVILDACRNNPFARSFRSSEQGLARMDAPVGTIIAYATGPGSVAADGRGRNGIYTKHLLQTLARPQLTIQDIFNEAGMGVMQETENLQIPWTSNTPIPRFYLAGGNPDEVIEKGGRLTVRTSPAEATVRLLNISPAYSPGMALDAGRYHVEVTAPGYDRDDRWVELAAGDDMIVDFSLTRERAIVVAPVQQASSSASGGSFTDPTTGMEFVAVPGGCFQMGSPASEKDRQEDEGPLHEVCVDGFSMAKHEVTVGQWRQFIRESGYRTEAEKDTNEEGCYSFKENKWGYHDGRYWDEVGFAQTDNQPVACVSHNDVGEFIRWLNRKSGRDYRLPTEAEWEYAARGGTTTSRFWGEGEEAACEFGNVGNKAYFNNAFSCDDGHKWSTPVGTFKASSFGLYDMLGNVWEWTGDWYGKDYYGNSPRQNPDGPSSGSVRVSRGGSWYDGPTYVRAASRNDQPWGRGSDLGFRILASRTAER
jgi:formylglycine-generating enzyme required for sulfatase activity